MTGFFSFFGMALGSRSTLDKNTEVASLIFFPSLFQAVPGRFSLYYPGPGVGFFFDRGTNLLSVDPKADTLELHGLFFLSCLFLSYSLSLYWPGPGTSGLPFICAENRDPEEWKAGFADFSPFLLSRLLYDLLFGCYSGIIYPEKYAPGPMTPFSGSLSSNLSTVEPKN